MSRRVLLTGAAGFLGAHCLRHLLENTDWHIICPVTFNHKGLPARLDTFVDRDEWWQRLDILRLDLAAPVDDVSAARIGPVDYIINYAAGSHVDRSIRDPVPFVRNNVDIMLHTLEYARTVKPKAFVQISTDEVYGSAPPGREHREWDPIVPSSPYSASKAAQEAIAIAYWRTYAVPVMIVNSMNLVGETQDPEKYVSMVINHVLAGDEVPVHAAPDGTIGSRFYLHARNLADAVLFLLNRGIPTAFGGVDISVPDRWNVVGDHELDNLEMAQLVAKLLDRELRHRLVDFNATRPGHDLRYALNGRKLADAGWVAPLGFEESMRQLVDWTLAHPLWAARTSPSQASVEEGVKRALA